MEQARIVAIIITFFIISVLILIKALKLNSQNNISRLQNEQEKQKISVKQEELDKENLTLLQAKNDLQEEKKAFNEYKKTKEDEYFYKLEKIQDLKLSNDQKYFEKVNILNQKDQELEIKKQKIINDLEKLEQSKTEELLKLVGISKKEAKIKLFNALKSTYKNEYVKEMKRHQEVLELAKLEISKEILLKSIENIGVECSNEAIFKPIKLKNDDIKGKLIGKEGRNIRLMENLLGANIIIDDTPGMIGVSCFNSTRRHIATLVIEKLIASGKINQVVIEEIVEKTKEEIDIFILEKGKEAIYKFEINDMDINLIKAIGHLYFRSSYGQNVYYHTLEAASIAYKLAKEFKMDANLAARCALLHDIGKVDAIETGDTHVAIGVALAKQYNEIDDVINAIEAHHDDVEASSYYAIILQIADRISAGREGIRKENYDQYIKRVTSLENIALEEDGVLRAFALQGARELRIIVESRKVNDEEMKILAHELKHKIANNITFPGKIKINMIREVRFQTDTSNKVSGDYE